MKKLIEKILIPISMIGGYGLMGLLFCVVAIALAYILAELISITLIEPSPLIVLANIITVAAIIFLFTRKKVRAGFSEAWKQISRNI